MITADFDVSKSLDILLKCWELAKKNYSLILGVSVLGFILHKVVSVIPLFGFVLSPVIAVIITAGLLRITKKLYHGESASFDELFYFFKMLSERGRLVKLGLLAALVIFVFRMLFFVLTFFNPFSSGVEFFVGVFESFTLFFISILVLPEMIYRGQNTQSAFDIASKLFKSYWPFWLSLLMISWLFATATTMLLVVPFFLLYLPTIAFLPYVLNQEMKITVY